MATVGFIRDKLDVKMLILYLMDRVVSPIDFDALADLCLRHEGVDYFALAEAVSEMVGSAHLSLTGELYAITEIGRRAAAACESSLPVSVRRRCCRDLAGLNARLRRNAQVRGESHPLGDGSVRAKMTLDDDGGNLLAIELLCPSQAQADRLIAGFKAQPERVYNEVLEALTAPAQEE